jgi:hypothetical protein
MTISDRRLDRVWRKKVAPVVSSIDSWADVTPHHASSSWVAADPESTLVFERDRARLGEDLAAIWRGSDREILLPVARELQRLSDRAAPDDQGGSREISSTVYEMQ